MVGELEGQSEEDGDSKMPHSWWHGTWLCRHTGTHGRGSAGGSGSKTSHLSTHGREEAAGGSQGVSVPPFLFCCFLLRAPRGGSCHLGPWGQWWPR